MSRMSLNKLFYRHQRALIRAASSEHQPEQDKLEAEADAIAADISEIQDARGAKAAQLLPAANISALEKPPTANSLPIRALRPWA